MTKKLKLSVIVNPDFAWAISNIINAQVPAKAAYWLSKLFKKVQSHEKLYQKTRHEAMKKYTEMDGQNPDGTEKIKLNEKNEAVFKSPEDKEKFVKEIEELMEQEVEVPTVHFSLFGDDTKLETRHLILLDEVIVLPEENAQ